MNIILIHCLMLHDVTCTARLLNIIVGNVKLTTIVVLQCSVTCHVCNIVQCKTMNKNDIHCKTHNRITASNMCALYCL